MDMLSAISPADALRASAAIYRPEVRLAAARRIERDFPSKRSRIAREHFLQLVGETAERAAASGGHLHLTPETMREAASLVYDRILIDAHGPSMGPSISSSMCGGTDGGTDDAVTAREAVSHFRHGAASAAGVPKPIGLPKDEHGPLRRIANLYDQADVDRIALSQRLCGASGVTGSVLVAPAPFNEAPLYDNDELAATVPPLPLTQIHPMRPRRRPQPAKGTRTLRRSASDVALPPLQRAGRGERGVDVEADGARRSRQVPSVDGTRTVVSSASLPKLGRGQGRARDVANGSESDCAAPDPAPFHAPPRRGGSKLGVTGGVGVGCRPAPMKRQATNMLLSNEDLHVRNLHRITPPLPCSISTHL